MTSTVHTDYGLNGPPPPSPNSSRFVCISDSHSQVYDNIPLGDVLIHAGDLSSWGYWSQLNYTIEWLKLLPHPIKMWLLTGTSLLFIMLMLISLRIIAGNHDVGSLNPRVKHRDSFL